MAVNSSPVKALLRGIAAAALLIGFAAAGPPALAASNHPFQTFKSGNGGDSGAFNLDQDPCRGGGGGRGRGRFAGGDCRGAGRNHPNNDNGEMHQPGSRAFGLQFNNDNY